VIDSVKAKPPLQARVSTKPLRMGPGIELMLNLFELKSIEAWKPEDLLRVAIKCRGEVKSFFVPYWGSINGEHLLKQEVLWYPFTLSCRNPILGMLTKHDEAKLEVHSSLDVASSLELEDCEGNTSTWTQKGRISPISLLAANFTLHRTNADDIELYLYKKENLSLPFKTKELSETITEALTFYKEKFGLNYPFRQLHLVLPKGGGFSDDCLIVLDYSLMKSMEGFKANLLHELAHVWFGSLLVPGGLRNIMAWRSVTRIRHNCRA